MCASSTCFCKRNITAYRTYYTCIYYFSHAAVWCNRQKWTNDRLPVHFISHRCNPGIFSICLLFFFYRSHSNQFHSNIWNTVLSFNMFAAVVLVAVTSATDASVLKFCNSGMHCTRNCSIGVEDYLFVKNGIYASWKCHETQIPNACNSFSIIIFFTVSESSSLVSHFIYAGVFAFSSMECEHKHIYFCLSRQRKTFTAWSTWIQNEPERKQEQEQERKQNKNIIRILKLASKVFEMCARQWRAWSAEMEEKAKKKK